ncbi:MAG: transposase [Desulfuromonadaceae bacterium]|nr:transposase [Desulfuromonadaceae bacterium]MDD5104152.1 transposase [Desulfuromonadaceae bacterium]
MFAARFNQANFTISRGRVKTAHYIRHVKQRGEEIRKKKDHPEFRCRRWIVEVAHSRFNRFRKLLVRYKKLTKTYEALSHMAAIIIALRKAGVIYG